MSIPMSQCTNVKAAKGDEEAYEQLKKAMETNLTCGHFMTAPCPHDPPCVATQDEVNALNLRLKADVFDNLEKKRNEAARKFDQEQKVVSSLYHAAAKYADTFDREVELMKTCCHGFPGVAGGERSPHDYSDQIMLAALDLLIKCFSRSVSAKGDKKLFEALKESVKQQEGRFNLGEGTQEEKP